MVYYQAMAIVATAGNVVYDDGLRSTSENPKRLLSIIGNVKQETDDTSMLQVWFEQEKIAEIPMPCIDSRRSQANNVMGMNRLNEIEIGFDIPIGAVVKVAVKSVGADQTFHGAYRYEISA